MIIRKLFLGVVIAAFLFGFCGMAICLQDNNAAEANEVVSQEGDNKADDDPYQIVSSEEGPTEGVVYTRDAMGNKVPVDTQKTGERISCEEPL